MSTAVLTRPAPIATPVVKTTAKPKRITLPTVRSALEDIAARHPFKFDTRVLLNEPAELTPYVDRGAPACLVARVLERLGYSIGILRALDAEHPVGDLFHAGVRIDEARHPALRRIDANARALLAWVQAQEVRGRCWGRIVRAAFRPKPIWTRAKRDRERRPWLYC